MLINMTDPNQDCPQGLSLTGFSIRSCGRGHTSSTDCSSVTFPVNGQYSQVCGRVTAYRWGFSHAFLEYHVRGQTIEDPYVDGLSFTHGSPRTHIWTFASGLFSGTSTSSLQNRCPCEPGSTYGSPLFVGNDYFCDTVATQSNFGDNHPRLFSENALWDGEDLLNPCYGFNNPPWFNKSLPVSTNDSIELRMCFNNYAMNANLAIELLELYVH